MGTKTTIKTTIYLGTARGEVPIAELSDLEKDLLRLQGLLPAARFEVVALTSGTQGDVRARCGHHHRTEEAAEKCLAKLSASHEETPGVQVSSLYHGRVRPVVR